MKAILLAIIGCLCATLGFTQTSTLLNTGTTGDFLGWDDMTAFDLEIKTEAATNIGFFTNNVPRAAILANGALLFGVPGVQGGANISVGNQSTSSNDNIGVRGHVPAPQDITGIYGGRFSAEFGSTRSIGIRGRSYGSGSQFNYGIGAEVCNNFENSEAIAIFGRIRPGCVGSSWALYLEGPTFTPGGEWSASDGNLKLNIENLESGLQLVLDLSPKSYEFDGNVSFMPLPQGTQYGLLAQELALVIPHAVTEVIDPDFHSEEIVTNEFLAVNYQQLIPVLISAFQERQAGLDQQQQIIAQLEQAIEAVEIQMSQITTD